MNKSIDLKDIPPLYVIKDLCGAEFKNERVSGKGEQLVRCPIYPKKTFEVNIAHHGAWKCFSNCSGCPANGGGGLLDFYVLFNSNCRDRKDAFREIAKALNGDTNGTIERRKAETPQAKAMMPVAEAQRLHDVYTAFLNKIPLSEIHLKDLKNRGLSDKDIKRMGFKSIPQNGINNFANELMDEGFKLSGVPGFYSKGGTVAMALLGSGYFIPYRDKDGRIIALQIRKDVFIKDDMSEEKINELKKARYRWFTSSNYENGAQASNIPFYGIPDAKVSKPEIVCATEGGLKAAVAQSLIKRRFVAIPGISCFTAWEELLEQLKKEGVKQIIDTFDSDRATNPNVANAIDKLYYLAREHGFEMTPWDWGTEYKGIDDYLLSTKKRR